MSAATKGPLRSAATDTTTTFLGVIAGARRVTADGRSLPRSRAVQLHLDRGTALERLVDDAIALGELEQRVELVRRRVGLDVEAQANRRKTDRRILGHAERAAKVEIAFGRHLAGLEWNVERGRHRLERHAGAGNQRLH